MFTRSREYTSQEVAFHISMILLTMAMTLITSENFMFMYLVPTWIRKR